MSKKGKQASGKALAGISEPIFDFLYQDKQRIASFLAQFDPSGYLDRIKQIESASKSQSKTGSGSLSGNVIAAQASGSAWNDGGKARSQAATFKFETLGDFV